MTYKRGNSTNSAAAAASASKRKSVTKLAEALEMAPIHTESPSEDFEFFLEKIPEKMKKKALHWYLNGIRRGMKIATDKMANEEITFDGTHVLAPSLIKTKVKFRVKGSDWDSRVVKIKATEIGFEKM